MNKRIISILILSAAILFIAFTVADLDPRLGSLSYKDFETPKYCGTSCHTDFYRQWEQAMMSQAYTHEWDEIEYFDLAVAHGENDPAFKDAHIGCNGCHTPMAYLAGDTPPPKPDENSRANESVSCDVCHLITGFKGDIPFNFNFTIEPGKTKYSSRKGNTESPNHKIQLSPLHKRGDFCGICHNEKNSFGIWVKSTHLEWKEGPYYKEGVQCQDCHMPIAEGKTASMGESYPNARQHLFHGAHDPGKVKGTIELRIHPDIRAVEPDETVKFTIALFNQKTGHKFPTGSVEDRIAWLHVEAEDASGNKYHIPVDKKGFVGEDFTIAKDELAYTDMGKAMGKSDFKGVQRDGIPVGNRIFRMPFLDENGIMTILQWNTRTLGVDYRIGPRETKLETFTFNLPYDVEPGTMKITATLNYQLLVQPVAEYLNVPKEEYKIIEVNKHFTTIEIVD